MRWFAERVVLSNFIFSFMKTSKNIYSLGLTLCAAAVLTACGGGGGGSASGGSSGTTVSVSPSLGKFSTGAVVVIKSLAGTEVGRGTIGSDGKAAVNVGSHSGAIVVEVLGAAGVKYYDEGTGTDKDFGSGEKLSAISPDVKNSIGVTPATNAAVEAIKAANTADTSKIPSTLSTSAIDLANTKIATALGITNVLQAPALVDSTTSTVGGTKLDIANVQDKYALQLAALAKLGTSALEVSKSLAQDLSDGKIDGQQGATPLTTAYTVATLTSGMTTQLTAAASDFGTADTAKMVTADPTVLGTVTTNVADVTAPPTGTSTSDVQLAKDMISELRTTFGAVLSNLSGSFMQTQAKRATEDLGKNVAPNVDKVVNRLSVLNSAVRVYEGAIATPVWSELVDQTSQYWRPGHGNLIDLWNGYGYGASTQWNQCTVPKPVTSTSVVTCVMAGPDSVDRTNGLIKFVKFELTPTTTPNSYTYKSIRVNRKVTTNMDGTFSDWNGTGYEPKDANDVKLIPDGSGTLVKTVVSGVTSSYAVAGTLVPSTSNTGLDTVNMSAVRTLISGTTYRYDLQGSVATSSDTAGTKVVTIALDTGSNAVKDESTGNGTSMSLKLVAQTVATKFTGTLTADTAVTTLRGDYQPSHFNFKGTMADTSTGGAGEFLTGTLDGKFANLATFKENDPITDSNYKQVTVSFTGTVQATSRPLMKLVLAGTATGPNSGTATLNYSYGTVSVTGTGTEINGVGTMTLSNQAGLQIAKDPAVANQNLITKAGKTLAEIKNAVISYVDGTSVTF